MAVDRVAHLVVDGTMEELFRTAAPYGIEKVATHEADLEGIFVEYHQER